jgi:Concanavalin A-like lectin/glucanases superfamily
MKRLALVFGLFCMLFVAIPLMAQPFGSYLSIPSGEGYIAIPHSADFDFTTGFTFEAWVSIRDGGACSNIFGNQYTVAQWVGICGTTLRSYDRGTSSLYDAGKVPANDWTHIAVTWDGTNRKHYVDGELVGTHAESGNLTNATGEIRIGSDVAYANHSPIGQIDEVRIWNVGLTQAQIRANINQKITTAQPGLVAVYHLDGNGLDAFSTHNGGVTGTAVFGSQAVVGACTNTATALCIGSNRFSVTVKWLTTDGSTGVGTVVPGYSADSGLFWFFGSTNWELLVKLLDGCALNSRKWFFSAATTDQHFEAVVTDVANGVTKRYFNYLGVAAPANTDTGAFATCP